MKPLLLFRLLCGYLHVCVLTPQCQVLRRTWVTTRGLTTLAQWTCDVEGACTCHIFLVLHFQIGQPILGTNLVFYSILVVFFASQMFPDAGTIIFLKGRRSSPLLRSATNVRLGRNSYKNIFFIVVIWQIQRAALAATAVKWLISPRWNWLALQDNRSLDLE